MLQKKILSLWHIQWTPSLETLGRGDPADSLWTSFEELVLWSTFPGKIELESLDGWTKAAKKEKGLGLLGLIEKGIITEEEYEKRVKQKTRIG